MSVAQVTPEQQITLHFFDFLFGKRGGYICIATQSPNKSNFKQAFFKWPGEAPILAKFVDDQTKNKNVWFCVNLLGREERKKEYCLESSFAWADLDYIIPTKDSDNGDVPYPSCVVESSPARFQAYWKIEGAPVPAEVAEEFSRKIAYSMGADKSGWDLTQLLRIPLTNNFKYEPTVQVRIRDIDNTEYSLDTFDKIQVAIPEADEQPFAEIPDDLPKWDAVLYKFRSEGRISDEFALMFATEPEAKADWSKILWRFIHECIRVGMTKEETFVVANEAKCNKHRRDNHPISYLWREVVKAAQEYTQFEILRSGDIGIPTMPHLADWDEFEEDTFIKDYKAWANQATDAPQQYHELACFVTLSAILSSGLYVRTSHTKTVNPNIWGLVLGESTLTRKTTAMRIATDLIQSIDPELIVATDSSVEGLLTSLGHRPNRVSMFVRDEVSGFFDSMKKKDYLTGMAETLTQLFDVPKLYTRVLRKETVTIQEPYFIFFGGGIRDKVYSIITEEWITSGFIPRFLVVSGENDFGRLRPTGPPTELSLERFDTLITHLADMRERFTNSVTNTIVGQPVTIPVQIEAKLTDDAWRVYQEMEHKLQEAGTTSDIPMTAIPMFMRLAGHLLKLSLLVAGSRREPDSANFLTVEEKDIKQAAFYTEHWGHYSVDLMLNSGKSEYEKLVDRALGLIRLYNGLQAGQLGNKLHLQARDNKELIETLYQRGLVDVQKSGRGQRLYIIG